MKRILLVAFLATASLSGYCQLKVQVKDATTKLPLSFATAECMEKRWGGYTDSSGIIIIPDSIWTSCKMIFSFVGYSAANVQLKKGSNEVLMVKSIRKLEDVAIKTCKEFTDEKVEVRSRKRNYSFGFSGGSKGFMWATYLPNNVKKKGWIESVSFGAKAFHKDAKMDAPVRLRIYEFDISAQLPGDEITTEIITLIPRKQGWKTIDISKHRIALPLEGIVVAFEMFDAGPQYYYKSQVYVGKKKKEITRYGWSILGIVEDSVLGFSKWPGRTWHIYNTAHNAGRAPQVSIKMSVCK
jgi:hypothetical protein